MRLKDRKAVWIGKLHDMTPFQTAGELAKLERELERKNEDVNFLSKIHSRSAEDWRRYHNRKMNEMVELLREKEKVIDDLKCVLDRES